MIVTSIWITQTEGSLVFNAPKVSEDYVLKKYCNLSSETIVPNVTHTDIQLTATAEVEAEIAADPNYPVVGG
jgi:hypothetical protein